MDEIVTTEDDNEYIEPGHIWAGKRHPERTQGVGSGYIRGFWTHVTTSHGREIR